ncbi:hypothetical protein MCOR31_011888, partial [Pyricularia oryzae]
GAAWIPLWPGRSPRTMASSRPTTGSMKTRPLCRDSSPFGLKTWSSSSGPLAGLPIRQEVGWLHPPLLELQDPAIQVP